MSGIVNHVYGKALRAFFDKLLIEHQEKGMSFLEMTDMDLFEILREEIDELESAIFPCNTHNMDPDWDNIIEEGSDIMICGLLFIMWAMEHH